MKKLTTLLFLFLFSTLLHAQISRNNLVTVTNSRDLAGIRPLTAEQTFNYVIPTSLHFWAQIGNAPPPGGTFNRIDPTVPWVAARRSSNNPDYIFTLVTNGIENLSGPTVIPHGGMRAVEYTYTFSVRMELHNRAGDLLKTFILSPGDREHRRVVLPDFLYDARAAGTPVPQTTAPIGFRGRDEDILKWIDSNENRILARMEHDALREKVRFGSEIISAYFGFPRIDGRPTIFGLHRRDVALFPELNNAVEILQAQIEEVFRREPISEELRQQLIRSGNFFAAQYTSESDQAMIQLAATNAGVAFILAGKTEEAGIHFLAALDALPLLRGSAATAIFNRVAFINQFRENGNEIMVIPALPVTDYRPIQ